MKTKMFHNIVEEIAKNYKPFTVVYIFKKPQISTCNMKLVLKLKKLLNAKIIDTHRYEDGEIRYTVGFKKKKKKSK